MREGDPVEGGEAPRTQLEWERAVSHEVREDLEKPNGREIALQKLERLEENLRAQNEANVHDDAIRFVAELSKQVRQRPA